MAKLKYILLLLLVLEARAFAINYVDQAYLSQFGRNYIRNGGAEQGRSGWTTYADVAGTSPTDGTGGSPTHITLTTSSSSPISEQYSFLMTNAGSSSAQGEGVSYAFTVDAGHQATALQIAFDYTIASGTFVSGSQGPTISASDVTVWIYDMTNAVVLQPAPYVLTGNGANFFHYRGTFQTASNSTSYRLIFHVGSTNTSAWVLKFDNVSVGPQNAPAGPAMTDAVAYTPTFTGFGTVAASTFLSKRVGDRLVVQGFWTQGTPAGGVASVTLGYNGTNSNVTTASNVPTGPSICGYWSTNQNDLMGSVLFAPNDTKMTFAITNGSNNGLTNAAATTMTGSSAGANLSLFCEIPIQGWSSNTLMSGDTDTRVAALKVHASSGVSMGTISGSFSAVTYNTVDNDTHGAYNTSTGVYTIPVAGYYDFAAQVATSGTPASGTLFEIDLYNVTTTTELAYFQQTAYSTANNVVVTPLNVKSLYLTAGTQVEIRALFTGTYTGGAYSSVATANYFTVSRQSGPAAIAATDSVTARYHASGTSISGSLATVSWTTKDWDSHLGMSSGTYTVPVSGKYAVYSCVAFTANSASAGNAVDLQLQQNGSAVGEKAPVYQSTQVVLPVCIADTINALAGDTIRVQVSSGASTPSIVSSNTKNFFNIVRLGN